MEKFTENVIHKILEVPIGKVATYGQIARLVGNPKAARQVSRILHSVSNKYQLPWHRIVNVKGEIVISDVNKQKSLLEKEGIVINSHMCINLDTYQWVNEDPDREWMEG